MQMALLNWLEEPFDVTNKDHTEVLTYGGWFMISAFLYPAKWAVFWLFIPTYLYFQAFPEEFVDGSGYALDGYGKVVARTHDLV